MNKLLFVLLSMMSLVASAVYACQNHGGMGFGIYGGRHMGNGAANAGWQAPRIELSHPVLITTELGKEATINIGYTLPYAVTKAKLNIEPSGNIAMSSENEVPLDSRSGVQTISFTVNEAGEHKIMLQVEGMKGLRPEVLVRNISVRTTS